jgi:hypothetical protein
MSGSDGDGGDGTGGVFVAVRNELAAIRVELAVFGVEQ